MLKAIQTQYKGYKFRSRLEARWAVFFEVMSKSSLLGEWRYEEEGFDLYGHGFYLPDFSIYHGVHKIFIEIKATKPTKKEFLKGMVIAHETKKPFYFLCQTPEPRQDKNATPKINGWCFIPANCEFMFSDDHFSMFEYYKNTLPEFLECGVNECFEKDNEYYLKKHGLNHPNHSKLGRLSEIGIDIPFFMRGCLKDPNTLLNKAALAARQARFEHGETPC